MLTSSLTEILDSTRREERRRALRSLLRQVVLFDPGYGDSKRRGSGGDEDFVLVRRHADFLGGWFARYTGWTLIVRADSARLVKSPIETDDSTRMAINPGSTGGPLTRSRYVLWCLLLMVLHDEGRQTTLQRLADQTIRTADAIPELQQSGCQYDLKSVSTRRGLVCVVRVAVRYGILHRVGGSENRFGQNESADCLYNIHPGLLADVLPLPADWTIQRLLDPPGIDDEEEVRGRQLEHRLMRRLLDDPLMYFDDLTQREFQYFQSQRARLFDVLEAAVGLVPELRHEGVAMLDPGGDLTDVKMPDTGTIGHATLLIAEHLSTISTSVNRCSRETLLAKLDTLTQQYGTLWKKGITETSQQSLLLDQCLQRLEMLRLIRFDSSDAIIVLPAICRFVAEGVPMPDEVVPGEPIPDEPVPGAPKARSRV